MEVGTGIVKEAMLTAGAMATIVTTGVVIMAVLGVAAGIPAEVAKILPYLVITEKIMGMIITEKWIAAAEKIMDMTIAQKWVTAAAPCADGEAAAPGENATIAAGTGVVARRLMVKG